MIASQIGWYITKGISKAVNLRLVAAGFDEVKDDVVYRRIRKLKFGLLYSGRPHGIRERPITITQR
jgi:hypothetical protein